MSSEHSLGEICILCIIYIYLYLLLFSCMNIMGWLLWTIDRVCKYGCIRCVDACTTRLLSALGHLMFLVTAYIVPMYLIQDISGLLCMSCRIESPSGTVLRSVGYLWCYIMLHEMFRDIYNRQIKLVVILDQQFKLLYHRLDVRYFVTNFCILNTICALDVQAKKKKKLHCPT